MTVREKRAMRKKLTESGVGDTQLTQRRREGWNVICGGKGIVLFRRSSSGLYRYRICK